MKAKKRSWFWNIVVILTSIGCLLAFVIHFKNWTRVKDQNFEIISGIYHQKIPYGDMNSISWEQKLPKMERIDGFSAFTTEKGVFKDSITNNSVYVFVDDLRQRKIQLTYQDSLKMFLNFSDSIQTQKQYDSFIRNMEKYKTE